VKLVSEADDPLAAGAAVVRLHLYLGIGLAAFLALFATPISRLFHAPSVAMPLRLFALDIPIFCIGAAHRNVLVAMGQFRARAVGSAGRWLMRLLFIVLLVAHGCSITGAVLGNIGASVVELAICRKFVKPPIFGAVRWPDADFWKCLTPLFLFSISLRVYERLDIMSLKALGGSIAKVGVYGAAQNVAMIPTTFAIAVTPLLLSHLTRLVKEKTEAQARRFISDSLRLCLWFLPLCGVLAGSADEIARVCFGARFAAAGPLMAWLFFGASAGAIISVASAPLITAGKSAWTIAVSLPMTALAFGCYLLLVPRFGALGAAQISAAWQVVGAAASLFAVYRASGANLPLLSLPRCLMSGACALALGLEWHATAWTLLPKLLALTLVAVAALFATGETRDITSRLRRRALPGF
jgi:O-antigen/teichoic acid export membrane protein